ncbi:hypothetical protein NQ318_004699 [Aromia moschata]|uniref:Reverse transcriptase domain-containing protein n=1 Tax=Aromia moschata TaxID=1265417 RepID=A0AAV8XI25_9CUCU|nr:hypothetical protein NQ318_004699 [Aromia moschata]
MTTEVKKSLKECNNLITPSLRQKLQLSNPVIPKLYCLPKIHKPGKSVRPIVSAIGSPTYNLSKWLTNEFENLPIAQTRFSVKNSSEFIDYIKNIQLQEGEILVSFDVCSLFPSVPIPQTLDYLRELLELNGLDDKIIKEYIGLLYNGEYFQQHEGTAMGNSLSPFIANRFMSKIETEVKDKFEYFPRVWFRYVDDIFAVFNRKAISLDNFVAKLNNRFPTINFTYEVEHNEQLPFLDVLVIRNSENKLEFDVYRKETATLRYIPNDSHQPFQHKMASFNFLIHRLLNFPLSKERFEHEKQLIKNIAKSNGYSVHLIDKLIRKHKFKRTLYNSTTFRRDTDNSKFASLPYEPKFTRGLDTIFKNININLVYNSKNKLQTLLGKPKDKIDNNEKSGIYEISCKDCDQKYIGQTKKIYID